MSGSPPVSRRLEYYESQIKQTGFTVTPKPSHFTQCSTVTMRYCQFMHC